MMMHQYLQFLKIFYHLTQLMVEYKQSELFKFSQIHLDDDGNILFTFNKGYNILFGITGH